MSITAVCHKCGNFVTAPDSAAGTQCQCPHCGAKVQIPGGVAKHCCVCQVDVANAPRTKDAAGNYYCAACGAAAAHTAKPAADLAISALTDAGPAARCVLCKAEVSGGKVVNFNGQLVCHRCVAAEGLGTMPYRLRKPRLGSARVVYHCPKCRGELESALAEAGKPDVCPQCGCDLEVPGRYEEFKAREAGGAATAVSTVATNAPAPAAGQPPVSPGVPASPPRRTATGNGKWLVTGASVAALVLVLAAAVTYVMMRPKASPPPAKPTTQAGAAKAKATAVAKPAAVKSAQTKAAAAKLAAVEAANAKAAQAARLAAAKAAKFAVDEAAKAKAAATAGATAARWHEIGLPVRAGGAVVTVAALKLRDVPLIDLDGSADQSAHRLLEVFISIRDRSAKRILHYSTWRGNVIGNHRGSLGDDEGNYYRQCSFGVGVKLKGQSRAISDVYPGKTVRDVLVFERPVAAAKVLRLMLPGGNIGWSHKLRFAFPVPRGAGK